MNFVEKKEYGFKITFAGSINSDEMAEWVEFSKNVLSDQKTNFGVLVDMRDLSPLTVKAKEIMESGQKLYKEKGMIRSAVIVSQGYLATQFKMIALQSGIYEWERYLNADSNPNWENIAIDWVKNGRDPDIFG